VLNISSLINAIRIANKLYNYITTVLWAYTCMISCIEA